MNVTEKDYNVDDNDDDGDVAAIARQYTAKMNKVAIICKTPSPYS